MRKLLIVCLGILLVGCGKKETVVQGENDIAVDSLQETAPGQARTRSGEQTKREEVEHDRQERVTERGNAGSRSSPRRTFSDSGGAFALAFSPDGRQLATGGRNGILKLWDVATGQVKNKFDMRSSSHVTCVRFSPDGKTLAAASERAEGGTIRVWDSVTGNERVIGRPTDAVHSLAFSSDGGTLAAGGKALRLWQIGMEQDPISLREQGTVLSVAFSPSGKWLVAAPGRYTNGGVTAEIWDVEARRLRARLRRDGSDYVTSVAFSPEGNTLAIVEGLKTAYLWDLSTLHETTDQTVTEFCEANPDFEIVGSALEGVKVTALRSQSQIRSVAYSPDGKMLATWNMDNTAKVWDVMTGQELTTLSGESADSEFSDRCSVAFSPDGKTLVAASGNTVRFWDVEVSPRSALSQRQDVKKEAAEVDSVNGKPFALDGLASVSCAVYSPDGQVLAAGAKDRSAFPRSGVVRLWDVATGQTLATLRHPGEVRRAGGGGSSSDNDIRSLAFSPDGKTLATGTSLGTKVWEVAGGQELARLAGYGERGVGVFSVEFAPDGETLATASAAGVKLWEVTTWQERATLSDAVRSHARPGASPFSTGAAAFSPDGTTVAVAVGQNELRFFDPETGQEQTVVDTNLGPLHDVAFSHDAATVAATGGLGSKLWKYVIREGQITLQEQGRLPGTRRITYSPDHRLLATARWGGDRNFVKLWDVSLLQMRAFLRDTNACAFAPDGKTLVAFKIGTRRNKWTPKLEHWDVAELIKPGVLERQIEAAAAEFIDAVRDSGFNEAAGSALVAMAGHEAALPVLRDGLDDPDDQVRQGTVFALLHIGPKAIPVLKKALTDEDPRVQQAAAEALRNIDRAKDRLESKR